MPLGALVFFLVLLLAGIFLRKGYGFIFTIGAANIVVILGLLYFLSGRVRCPFCNKPGTVKMGEDDEGAMKCGTCGTIESQGILRPKFTREHEPGDSKSKRRKWRPPG